MDWKKLAWCAVLSGASMGLIACGDDDGMMPGPDDPNDGMTRVYVVSVVSVPAAETGPNPRAAGFNLDGLDSTGEGTSCVDSNPDYLSLTDPSETGVDNALAGLVPLLEAGAGIDLDETLATQIAEGSLLLLLQVSDIDSFSNDASVSLRLYLGEVPDGSELELSGATLAPGQTFDGTALGSAVTGSITGGRLRAQAPVLTIAINTGDLMFDLPISDAVIGASITPTALANGAIGGALTLADLRAIVEQVSPGNVDMVDALLPDFADIQPSADDEEVCEALSVGLLFSAVEAQLSGS